MHAQARPARTPAGPIARWLGGLLIAVGLGTQLSALAQPEPRPPSDYMFEGNDVTLAEAIRMARRVAALNVLTDPWLLTNVPNQATSSPLERRISFRLERHTPAEALGLLLQQNGLLWRWNPATRVGRVTHPLSPHATNDFSAVLLEPSVAERASTNLLEDLAFQDTPLPDVLSSLARETGLNVLLDPFRLAPRSAGDPTLTLSAAFNGITGWQALIALAENHGLGVVWNPKNQVLRLTTQERYRWERAHPLPELELTSADPAASQPQALIFLDAAPLADALPLLSQQTGLNILLPGSLASVAPGAEVAGKFRHLSALQVFRALVENFGLALTANSTGENGILRLAPWETVWEQIHRDPPLAASLPPVATPNETPGDLGMEGVPLARALPTLAHQAGLLLLLAPSAEARIAALSPDPATPPQVRFAFRRVTARQVLLALLAQNDLDLIWLPQTQTAHVVPCGSVPWTASPPAVPASRWGEVDVRVRFDATPLDVLLRALARRADIGLAPSPEPTPDAPSPRPWPEVSLDVQSCEPGRLLSALCANYGLRTTWDDTKAVLTLLERP